MSNNNDEKLKINHELSTDEQQHNFFLSNLSEQFRAYYIARGSVNANYYSDWNEEMTNESSKQLNKDNLLHYAKVNVYKLVYYIKLF